MTIEDKIKELAPYLKFAASKETAYGNAYNPDDEDQGVLHNHCGCVAYTVQQAFGGDIVSHKKHYWNVIDGVHYDLTRYKHSYAPRYDKSRKTPKRSSVNWRFETFNDRVEWAYHCHKL